MPLHFLIEKTHVAYAFVVFLFLLLMLCGRKQRKNAFLLQIDIWQNEMP